MHKSKEITIISPQNFITTNWTGGTTTQLYIYPPDSEYIKRNFQYRLSSAAVNLFESQFTQLQGIKRKLLVLDGEIVIEHKNQYTKKLHKFDMDEFDGCWDTTSKGTCIDFNLMLQGELSGKLTPYRLKCEEELKIKTSKETTELFIYLFKGNIEISSVDEKYNLLENHLFKALNISSLNILINSLADSEFVIIEIEKLESESDFS